MYINTTDGKAIVNFTQPASTFKSVTAATGLNLNTWTHVTGTFDGSTLKVYLNGRLSNSAAAVFTPTTGAAQSTLLGGSNFGSSENINGNLAHVAEWTRALTAVEVGRLALNPEILYPRNDGLVSRIVPTFSAGAGRAVVHPVSYGGTGTNGDVVTASSNYAVGLNDNLVLITGPISVLLPTGANAGEGRAFIMKLTSGAYASVSVSGGGTIDGNPYRIITNSTAVTFISDGTNYWTV
jgi:hypothetical protein